MLPDIFWKTKEGAVAAAATILFKNRNKMLRLQHGDPYGRALQPQHLLCCFPTRYGCSARRKVNIHGDGGGELIPSELYSQRFVWEWVYVLNCFTRARTADLSRNYMQRPLPLFWLCGVYSSCLQAHYGQDFCLLGKVLECRCSSSYRSYSRSASSFALFPSSFQMPNAPQLHC